MTSKRYKPAPVLPAVLVDGYCLPNDHPARKGIQIYGEALKALAGIETDATTSLAEVIK